MADQMSGYTRLFLVVCVGYYYVCFTDDQVLISCFFCEDSPNITFLSGEQTAVAGSPVNITCRVDSFPTSTITWYLDNQLLNTTLVSQETLDNTTQESIVTISSVTTMDSGTYTCEAGNLLSTVNMNTTLTVESESASYSIHMYTPYTQICT